MAKTASPPPPPAPQTTDGHQQGGGLLALVVLFALFAGLLYRLHLLLWRRIDQRIDAAVERVKTEIPPLLHVEAQVRREMGEFRQRITAMEARAHNVQDQIDSYRRERDQPRG